MVAKGFLKLPTLDILIKKKRLGSRDFWRIGNSVPNKGKSAIPPLCIDLDVLSSASDNTKLFAKNFSKSSNSKSSSSNWASLYLLSLLEQIENCIRLL